MINHLIFHDIIKEQHTTECLFKPSSQELKVDHESVKLVEDLHKVITKSPKRVHGVFNDFGNSYFKEFLDNYISNRKVNILENSKDVIGGHDKRSLKSNISKEVLATGGHIIISSYILHSNEYFVIAMLNNKKGKSIQYDVNGVPKLVSTEQIDFNLMDLACRINITEYINKKSNKNYICFFYAKGSISQYFIDYIGCRHFNQPKQNTKKLVQLIDVAANNANDPIKFKSEAYNYCNGKLKKGELVNIDDLSAHLYGEVFRENLQNIINENGFEIDNSFSIVSSELKRLISFQYQGDWLDLLKFDKKYIFNKNIRASSDGKTVILKKVPELIKILQNAGK